MRKALVLFLISAWCCAAAAPVLRFSTYFGGIDSDLQPSTAVADDGSIWVALATVSPDLPVSPDAAQKTLSSAPCTHIGAEGAPFPRCFDVYVAKLNPSGEILRATYLGGSRNDFLAGIRLDRAGNVWLAGATESADFPRAKVIGTPGASFSAGFVTQLSPDLSTILQSTVVIGATASAFTMDAAGAAFIGGSTISTALPVVGALQPSRAPGDASVAQGFIAKLTPAGGLAYATYFGGGYTRITSLAVDAAGGTVLGGVTTVPGELPAGGAQYGTPSGFWDDFAAKIAADGRPVAWLRHLGGGSGVDGPPVAVDVAGSIHIGGAALTKLSADGASVLSSRTLGFYAHAIALDGPSTIWLLAKGGLGAFGASASALQVDHRLISLVKLGETGPPVWATYIGGSGLDFGTSLAATPDGAVVVGTTESFDFPVNHAVQKGLHQKPDESPIREDAFVMRFGAAAAGPPAFPREGVTNAASYRSGEASPGSIVAIFGDDLGTMVRQASAFPLPRSLGDTSVTVNGVAAPLFYVSPSQINAQIPFETALGTAVVQVRRGDILSATQTLAMVAASPGLFEDISGFAAINAPLTGVRGGAWITLYATGLGAVDGPVSSGAPSGNPPPQVIGPLSVTLGGTPLEVTWAGLAPGFAGLYQVNAILPTDIANSFVFTYLPLVVRAGGRDSNAGLVGVSGR